MMPIGYFLYCIRAVETTLNLLSYVPIVDAKSLANINIHRSVVLFSVLNLVLFGVAGSG
jgi:hypothetical protein